MSIFSWFSSAAKWYGNLVLSVESHNFVFDYDERNKLLGGGDYFEMIDGIIEDAVFGDLEDFDEPPEIKLSPEIMKEMLRKWQVKVTDLKLSPANYEEGIKVLSAFFAKKSNENYPQAFGELIVEFRKTISQDPDLFEKIFVSDVNQWLFDISQRTLKPENFMLQIEYYKNVTSESQYKDILVAVAVMLKEFGENLSTLVGVKAELPVELRAALQEASSKITANNAKKEEPNPNIEEPQAVEPSLVDTVVPLSGVSNVPPAAVSVTPSSGKQSSFLSDLIYGVGRFLADNPKNLYLLMAGMVTAQATQSTNDQKSVQYAPAPASGAKPVEKIGHGIAHSIGSAAHNLTRNQLRDVIEEHSSSLTKHMRAKRDAPSNGEFQINNTPPQGGNVGNDPSFGGPLGKSVAADSNGGSVVSYASAAPSVTGGFSVVLVKSYNPDIAEQQVSTSAQAGNQGPSSTAISPDGSLVAIIWPGPNAIYARIYDRATMTPSSAGIITVNSNTQGISVYAAGGAFRSDNSTLDVTFYCGCSPNTYTVTQAVDATTGALIGSAAQFSSSGVNAYYPSSDAASNLGLRVWQQAEIVAQATDFTTGNTSPITAISPTSGSNVAPVVSCAPTASGLSCAVSVGSDPGADSPTNVTLIPVEVTTSSGTPQITAGTPVVMNTKPVFVPFVTSVALQKNPQNGLYYGLMAWEGESSNNTVFDVTATQFTQSGTTVNPVGPNFAPFTNSGGNIIAPSVAALGNNTYILAAPSAGGVGNATNGYDMIGVILNNELILQPSAVTIPFSPGQNVTLNSVGLEAGLPPRNVQVDYQPTISTSAVVFPPAQLPSTVNFSTNGNGGWSLQGDFAGVEQSMASGVIVQVTDLSAGNIPILVSAIGNSTVSVNNATITLQRNTVPPTSPPPPPSASTSSASTSSASTSATTTTSVAATTAARSTTAFVATSAAATNGPSGSGGGGGLSGGEIAGIAIGAVAGVAAIAGGAFIAAKCAFWSSPAVDSEKGSDVDSRVSHPFADQLRTKLGLKEYSDFNSTEGKRFCAAAERIEDEMKAKKVLEVKDSNLYVKYAAEAIKEKGYIINGGLNLDKMQSDGYESIASAAINLIPASPVLAP